MLLQERWVPGRMVDICLVFLGIIFISEIKQLNQVSLQ